MFNADNGRQASSQKIESMSDEFAADFEDFLADPSIDRQVKESLVKELRDVVANRSTAKEFAAGTYAQNSAGQPAQALGAGSGNQPNPPQPQVTPQPGQTMEDAALHVIMTSTQLPQGVKAGIIRMITPSDPNHLPVATDGTPTELVAARQALTDERDTNKNGSLAHKLAETERKLAEEKDENKSGSLAHQLKAAQRNAAGTNMVDKAAILPLVQAVEQAASRLDTHMMSSHIEGKTELDQAVAAAKTAVS